MQSFSISFHTTRALWFNEYIVLAFTPVNIDNQVTSIAYAPFLFFYIAKQCVCILAEMGLALSVGVLEVDNVLVYTLMILFA